MKGPKHQEGQEGLLPYEAMNSFDFVIRFSFLGSEF